MGVLYNRVVVATTIMIPDEGMEIQCPLYQKRIFAPDGLAAYMDAHPMRMCEQFEVHLSE